MTSQNRIFDDLSKLMTNAMGVAQGARTEAETALKGWVDRWLADRDFVTREEFEAVRDMAVKARTENAELRARLDRLDPAGASPATEGAAAGFAGDVYGVPPQPVPDPTASYAPVDPVAADAITTEGDAAASAQAARGPANGDATP